MLRRVAFLIFCGMLLTSTGTPGRAQDNPFADIVVVWLVDGTLWSGQVDGEAQQIAGPDVLAVSRSPDGRYVAYITAGLDRLAHDITDAELVVLDLSTGEQVTSIGSESLSAGNLEDYLVLEFSTPAWAANEAVLFNTQVLVEGPPGIVNRYDIQRLGLDGAVNELVPAGDGGVLIPNPSHQLMAVVQPGIYSDPTAPGSVRFFNSQSGEFLPPAYSFDAVATGSEVPWLPRITWHHSQPQIGFAIPDPDLLYTPEAAPETKICRMSVETEANCQQLAVGYPAQPVWNMDLTRLVFTRTDAAAPNSRQVVVASPDSTVLTESPVLDTWPEPDLWLNDTHALFRTSLGETSGYWAMNSDTGEITGWRPTEEPVVSITKPGESMLAILSGGYMRQTISLYHVSSGALREIAVVEGGFARFGEH
ncbi:MAG: hypothetical protein GYB66_02265 [Chloroflexi bacterium]|nr:hypothetical protein [Chloroflexota bacterium]